MFSFVLGLNIYEHFALFSLDSGNVIDKLYCRSSQDTWNQCYKYRSHIIFKFLKHKPHKTDVSFGFSCVSLWR